jgi:hypothetical protein
LIGNSLHRVPDLTFDEDRARNRKDNGPETLNLLRNLPLNLLRKARPKLPTSRQTQTRRMVRRLRKIHHRPNAMALHQPTARVAANGTEG